MAQVRIILREDVPNLGRAGEVVNVRPGYARNFLLPTGKAIVATTARVNELEHHRRIIAERVAKELKDMGALRDRLEQLRLRIEAQVGEEGRLFGSVTSAQIAEELARQGIEVDRRKIELADPIKEAGEHRVPVRLHREVVANVTVEVAAAAT
jgi:large subunit ribosomal protein L9